MNLESYRVSEKITAGEWIELPDAPDARFLVRLPTDSNREWQRERMNLVDIALTPEGASKITTHAGDLWEKRVLLFRRICVLEGPPGFDLAKLDDEYWPALVKLYELAEHRVATESAAAEKATGES